VQTQRTRRHGQGMCTQVPGMRAQKACAWRVQARKRYAHTKGFVDVDLCRRRLRSRLCLWNMHNTQSKARAEGLYVDYPGYCLVEQVGSSCASVCRPLLNCLTTVVTSHRYARTIIKRNQNERINPFQVVPPHLYRSNDDFMLLRLYLPTFVYSNDV